MDQIFCAYQEPSSNLGALGRVIEVEKQAAFSLVDWRVIL